MIRFFLAALLSGYVLTLVRTIPTDAADFAVDTLGNIYLVYDYHIEKMSPKGELLYRSSDLGFGRICQLDVSNPLKPFVYYREQNILVTLDNTLSQQGNTIDLRSFDFAQVEMVGASRDNCYWIWDAPRSSLMRVDKDMKVLQTTPNLGNLLGIELNPMSVTETASAVYLTDQKAGVLAFDIFGTYRSRLPISFDGEVQVSGGHFLYHRGKELFIANPDIPGEQVIPLPSVPGRRVVYTGGQLYFISEKMLQVYSVDTSRD